jgi:hypothetical protein
LGLAPCAGSVLLRIADSAGHSTVAVQTALVSRTDADGQAPFEIDYTNVPFTVASYSVEIHPGSQTSSPATCQVQGTPAGAVRTSWYEVTGRVACAGTAEAMFVHVAAIFFDAQGQPIGTSQDIFMQARIAPGGSAPFNVRFADDRVPFRSVASFRVFVDWQ